MGQYWIVTSPDQHQQLSTLAWGKLREIFPGGNAGGYLEHLLMVPLQKQKYLFRPQANGIVPSSEYPKLSEFELLDNQGDQEQKEQLIPFLLDEIFNNYFGIWAAQRIICVGDSATSRPPTLEDVQQRLYNWRLPEVCPLQHGLDDIRKALDDQAKRVFDRSYMQLQTSHFPTHQQYVLINFTAKEYVVDLFYKTQHTIGLAYDRERSIWGLGDVVLSRICWSQDSSTSMKYSPQVEGEWAGHGLAIITLSIFDEMSGGREGWKDVTNDVWEELAEIWKAEGLR